MTFTCTAEL